MMRETASFNVEVKLEPEMSGPDRGRRSKCGVPGNRAANFASHFASISPIAGDAE
jgi:hypothetical protein